MVTGTMNLLNNVDTLHDGRGVAAEEAALGDPVDPTFGGHFTAPASRPERTTCSSSYSPARASAFAGVVARRELRRAVREYYVDPASSSCYVRTRGRVGTPRARSAVTPSAGGPSATRRGTQGGA